MNKYILLLVLVLVVGGAFLWSMEVRGEGSLVSTVCVDSDGGNNVNIKGAGMQYPDPIVVPSGSYVVPSECTLITLGIPSVLGRQCPIHSPNGSVLGEGDPYADTFKLLYLFDTAQTNPGGGEQSLTSQAEEAICSSFPSGKLSGNSYSAVPGTADVPTDVTLTLPPEIKWGAPGPNQTSVITKPANRVIPPNGDQ